MTTKRPTLRDREAVSLATGPRRQPDPAPVEPDQQTPSQETTTRRKPGPKPRADRPPTVRLGGYWKPGTFDIAKRGYLADLDTQPDSPDTFGGWIDRAIRKHAQLNPQRRQQIAAQLGEEPSEGRGNSRSFHVAASTVEAMEQAVADDRRHGRLISRAGFIAEAARAAVAEAAAATAPSCPQHPPDCPTSPLADKPSLIQLSRRPQGSRCVLHPGQPVRLHRAVGCR